MRHAQSQNNLMFNDTGRDNGRLADPELTELGQEQAQLLAQHVAQPLLSYEGHILDYQNRYGFGLTHLYCSLMIRAVETGRAVARACDLPLVAWPEIHERGGIYLLNQSTGEREGLAGNTRTYLTIRFPELVLPDEIDDNGWWNRPAETMDEAKVRAQRVLDQLLERHGDSEDKVGIISHGGFYQAFTALVLNMPPRLDFPDEVRTSRFGINNVSISRFVFTERTMDVLYLNNTRFLPVEYLT